MAQTQYGPWGGAGGGPFSMPASTRLVRIQYRSGEILDALKIQYELNGVVQWTNKWGGNGGNEKEIVFGNGEYLIAINGYHGKHYDARNVVTSLTFISNIRTYGPIGTKKGTPFSHPQVGNSKIVGFYGKCGQYVDSIGVYLQPVEIKPITPTTVKYDASSIQSHAGDVLFHSVSSPSVAVWEFQPGNRMMDITGKYIKSQLTLGTKYKIVIIVFLKADVGGWWLPLDVKLPDGTASTIEIPFDFPRDSWETIDVGEFIAAKGDSDEFKISDNSGQEKEGLQIRGFEFHPQ